MADNDILSFDGLETKDNLTLVEDLVTGFNDIYAQDGETLNLESNTPDGQLIELLAFAGTVIRELITEVYNTCDPDKCVGAVQDNRYQINYLTRKQGSYSLQNIAITVNKTVELQGLDASYDDTNVAAFAVSDDNGNVWYLRNTTTLTAGTTRVSFRAKEMGAIIPTIGTITNQVTVIPGVINVINDVGWTAIGTEEESDSDFRIRRASSVYKSSKNCADTILTELLELDTVNNAYVHQNNDSSTDATGTPAHYIWAIVEYGGTEEDKEKIAQVIYSNLGGAGTRGSISQTLVTQSMENLIINFDEPTIVPLYIKFNIKAITSPGEIYVTGIKQYITENLLYNIGEDAETSRVVNVCSEALLNDGGNGYALDVQISLGGSTAVTVTGSGVTSASVDDTQFQYAVGDSAGTYTFIYSSGDWTLNSDIVDLTTYGITAVGTPVNNDEIEVVYTASTWSDYIAVSSIADLFRTSENQIYITVS